MLSAKILLHVYLSLGASDCCQERCRTDFCIEMPDVGAFVCQGRHLIGKVGLLYRSNIK